ncbi:uncharacterized protein LOC119512678 isoform X1 [Choloepus didactylus]|uniref:uncharacterized protein LOC119512678 isoform X1 n=1 Tax=Choloepus didactylus TaxID=27675 RepID=UPI00189D7C4A|nr:uncharacterized protein LOC119512678 isoform X1 [Choloepus didactylus]
MGERVPGWQGERRLLLGSRGHLLSGWLSTRPDDRAHHCQAARPVTVRPTWYGQENQGRAAGRPHSQRWLDPQPLTSAWVNPTCKVKPKKPGHKRTPCGPVPFCQCLEQAKGTKRTPDVGALFCTSVTIRCAALLGHELVQLVAASFENVLAWSTPGGLQACGVRSPAPTSVMTSRWTGLLSSNSCCTLTVSQSLLVGQNLAGGFRGDDCAERTPWNSTIDRKEHPLAQPSSSSQDVAQRHHGEFPQHRKNVQIQGSPP